jgi:heat shock protein HslJ
MNNLKNIWIFVLLSCFYFILGAEPELDLVNKEFKVSVYSTIKLTEKSRYINLYHYLKFDSISMFVAGVCNTCDFNYELLGSNKVKFEKVKCTQNVCEGNKKDLEEDVINVLENAFILKIRGKFLVIIANNGKRLQLIQTN